MNLLCIIPGFGNPYYESKLEILTRNLKYISQFPGNIDLIICVYDELNIDFIKINCVYKNINIIIKYETGIIGEFLLKYTDPKALHDNNYWGVMILLDDIELQPSFHWNKILKLINDFDLDIFSPCLTKDSKVIYNYMLKKQSKSLLNIVNCCELFCYILPLKRYSNYYQLINKSNPWMWGVDLILKKVGNLKIGLSNSIQMRHYFQSNMSAHKNLRYSEMTNYLKTYNLTHIELSKLPWSIYEIY